MNSLRRLESIFSHLELNPVTAQNPITKAELIRDFIEKVELKQRPVDGYFLVEVLKEWENKNFSETSRKEILEYLHKEGMISFAALAIGIILLAESKNEGLFSFYFTLLASISIQERDIDSSLSISIDQTPIFSYICKSISLVSKDKEKFVEIFRLLKPEQSVLLDGWKALIDQKEYEIARKFTNDLDNKTNQLRLFLDEICKNSNLSFKEKLKAFEFYANCIPSGYHEIVRILIDQNDYEATKDLLSFILKSNNENLNFENLLIEICQDPKITPDKIQNYIQLSCSLGIHLLSYIGKPLRILAEKKEYETARVLLSSLPNEEIKKLSSATFNEAQFSIHFFLIQVCQDDALTAMQKQTYLHFCVSLGIDLCTTVITNTTSDITILEILMERKEYETAEALLSFLPEKEALKLANFSSPKQNHFFLKICGEDLSSKEKQKAILFCMKIGVDLTKKDIDDEENFLHILALNSDWETIQAIGAFIPKQIFEMKNEDEETALFCAISQLDFFRVDGSSKKAVKDCLRTIEALLNLGCSPLTQDKSNQTILSNSFISKEVTFFILRNLSSQVKEELFALTFPHSPLTRIYVDETIPFSIREQQIKELIAQGHKIDELLLTALTLRKDIQMIRYILSSVSPKERERIVNLSKNDWPSPLEASFSIPDERIRHEAIQAFISAGALLEKDGKNLLSWAYSLDNDDLIKTLEFSFSILQQEQITKLLHHKNANEEHPFFYFFMRIKESDLPKLLALFLRNGMDPYITYINGNTILHMLVLRTKTFLDNESSHQKPASNDHVHFTLQAYSIQTIQECLAILQPHLSSLANRTNYEGYRPLGLALKNEIETQEEIQKFSFSEFVSLFMDFKVDLLQKDLKGKTHLHEIFEICTTPNKRYPGKFTKTIFPLLEFLQALPNEQKDQLIQMSFPDSLLFQAWIDFTNGDRAHFYQLLKEGVDMEKLDSLGRNVLFYFISMDDIESLSILFYSHNQEKIAPLLNQEDELGQTPLFYLVDSDYLEEDFFSKLLSMQANFLHPNHLGQTAFDKLLENARENFMDIHKIISAFLKHKVFASQLSSYQVNEIVNLVLLSNGSKEEKKGCLELIKQTCPFPFLTLDRMIEVLEDRSSTIHSFVSFLKYKLPLYGGTKETDLQVKHLLEVALKNDNFEKLSYTLRLNENLTLDPSYLQRILTLAKEVGSPDKTDEILIAIQTCKDIDLLEKGTRALSLAPIYSEEEFLACPLDQQKALLSRYVVFRDRRGLAIASALIQKSAQDVHFLSPQLVFLCVDLIGKIQISFDPESDEIAFSELICALLPHMEEQTPEETQQLFGKALFSFAKLDVIRLQSQYKPGIYFALKIARKSNLQFVIQSCVEALREYSTNEKSQEDQEIAQTLIDLTKQEGNSIHLQRTLAEVLSSFRNEKALFRAWEMIESPLWDHHKAWEGAQEKTYPSGFDLFSFRPSGFHDNRENMQKKLLDVLGEIKREAWEAKIEQTYQDFKKNPAGYPSLQKFEKKLENIPESSRYIDPYYLPKNSVIFRGIGDRKGAERGAHALYDLFIRGAGDSELTQAKSHQGTWAKIGQIFCAVNSAYSIGYTDNHGAFMTIKSDYINEAITKRMVRMQNEGGLHYVVYDTISHENIKSIYLIQNLINELNLLRNANIENPPSSLEFFSGFDPVHLRMFILALKKDPHKLFDKLKPINDFGSFTPTEKDTTIDELKEENLKREILRNIVKNMYFPRRTQKLSKL